MLTTKVDRASFKSTVSFTSSTVGNSSRTSRSDSDEDIDLSLYDPGWLDDRRGRTYLHEHLNNFLISVLEGTRDQLSVLHSMNISTVGYEDLTDFNIRSLQERFGSNVSANFADYRINTPYTNAHRMQKILALMDLVLKTVVKEMKQRATFTTFETYIRDIKRNMEREFGVKTKLRRKIKGYKYLREELREVRRKALEVNSELSHLIMRTKMKSEDIRENFQAVKNFQSKWQNALVEQNKIALKNKEHGYNKIIDDSNENIEIDTRIHQEICLFTDETRDDYMEEIQHWMNLYDQELESRDNDIFKIKTKTENLKEKHAAMQAVYDKRAGEIRDYLEYKRLKKEKEDRVNFEIWAATRIQAWWRGVMVRKKLGPYKPKKKGKKGQKEKGKKKKK